MKLHPPFIITHRLMAGVQIGAAYISMGLGQRNAESRTQYGYFIKAGKFPENWDSHELREIIARKFINERTLDKKENCKRLRQFAVDYYSSNL